MMPLNIILFLRHFLDRIMIQLSLSLLAMMEPNGLSWKHYMKLFGNICISFMGAGILGLPYAFKEAGLVLGALTLLLVCVISIVGMLTLLDIKQHILQTQPKANKTSEITESAGVEKEEPQVELEFREVGYHAFGALGLLGVETAIVLSQIGFCCAYLIFITEALNELLPHISRLAFLIAVLVPLFFLVSLPRLNSLGCFSLLADVVTFCAYIIIVSCEFESLFSGDRSDERIGLANVRSFPFFFSVSIYCYEGAGLIFSLESSPHKSIRHNFKSIFITSMAVITTIYLLFGSLGYIAFGPWTHEIITSNISPGAATYTVKGFLSFSLLLTYPVMMFPVSVIMDRRLNVANSFSYVNILIRSLLVILTGCIIVLIPQFSTLMELVGATLCTLLNFIFPGFFYLAIIGKKNGIYQVLKCIGLIAFGLIGMIVGTSDVLKHFFINQPL